VEAQAARTGVPVEFYYLICEELVAMGRTKAERASLHRKVSGWLKDPAWNGEERPDKRRIALGAQAKFVIRTQVVDHCFTSAPCGETCAANSFSWQRERIAASHAFGSGALCPRE